jgi:hypothetical protein
MTNSLPVAAVQHQIAGFVCRLLKDCARTGKISGTDRLVTAMREHRISTQSHATPKRQRSASKRYTAMKPWSGYCQRKQADDTDCLRKTADKAV